jgi:hypothetical protein
MLAINVIEAYTSLFLFALVCVVLIVLGFLDKMRRNRR